MDCYSCEKPIQGTSFVRHPLLGPRHVNCGKVDAVCPIHHLTLPCGDCE